MELKRDIDITQFMKAVRLCSNDVFFVTAEGDRLNLKSVLSQFLFAAMQNKRELIDRGEIECTAPVDLERLRGYLAAN